MVLMRANTIPYMDFGRPGDVIFVDDTDTIDRDRETPRAVGWWIKVPMASMAGPSGNTIITYPNATVEPGDIMEVNGVQVTFQPPYTTEQIAKDLKNANIPNMNITVSGDAIMLTETTQGAIHVKNIQGTPVERLGLYSVDSFADQLARGVKINGKWVPIGALAGSSSGGSGGADPAATYLTLLPEGNLSGARSLNPKNGIKGTDNGQGAAYDLEMDIAGLPDETPAKDLYIPVENPNTGIKGKITADILVNSPDIGTNVTRAYGDVTNSRVQDKIIVANSFVKGVTLIIEQPFPPGTTIMIGTTSVPDLLMKSYENDPQVPGIYYSVLGMVFSTTETLTITVMGSPGTGKASYFVDAV
ncbi:MAG: hypothetical protein D6698_15175 [Gammaproteobacteria bacterium]|nr:MAG: hypothetical protein D6698_15175 [Gammaproteobacteria bacterium]